MAKQFEFADFVSEFKVEFTAYTASEGSYSSDGKWIPGGETPVVMEGIILPLNNDDLRFVGDGVYTEKARKIYTTQPLKMNQRIEYSGQSYLIKNERDYTAYADVFIYFAEGVST